MPIKVEFVELEHKRTFMKTVKSKNITTKSLGYDQEKPIIVVNELTRDNLELYKRTREYAKSNDYKICLDK